ncbi:MAG: sigma 54-interacting transcriptional regulator [Desulfatitalea sp.]|nr:sigma 54-interacting transcriptional regulator [Desulfatitalea sp.]NNJ99212.1 sigma 54-interacting transcriptional regulator [Desulfatitalea sp.]
MPVRKRIKTEYPGVYFIEGKTIGSIKNERIYYIVYRKNGRQIEKRVGRQFRDGMTPEKAHKIRVQCIESNHLGFNRSQGASNEEKHQVGLQGISKPRQKSETDFWPWETPGKTKDQQGLLTLQQAFKERLEFEALISNLSAGFINLQADQIDKEIEKSQKLVCQALGFHGSGLMEFAPDKKKMILRHSWCSPEITTLYPHQFIQDDFLSYLMDRLRMDKMFMFSDYTELPDDSEPIKQIAKDRGVTSALVFPLKAGSDILGMISWESFGVRREWAEEVVERLRLISDVFSNAISRKRTDEALANSIIEINKLKDRLEAEKLYLIDEIRDEFDHQKIVGQSKAINDVISQIHQVADTSATVLIQGETGTGKELIAHAVHNLSPRKDHPMVKVNCSALPAALIESELFGHEKGAFTGAVSKQIGRFELADGASIFLDEIGDLPLELQAKLLRVLQEGQFERLGSTKTLTVDARIIAATNRDLKAAVKEGRFRTDLYYRLNVFPITVPPLRRRAEDVPLLITSFVKEFSEVMGKKIDTIPNTTIEALQTYDWPGNIRELRNMVERAMIITKGNTLHIQLPEVSEPATHQFKTLDDLQRDHIITALEKCGGRLSGVRGAARLLGVNPKTLQSRMKRLGIHRKSEFC